jgi:hypothetical protein
VAGHHAVQHMWQNIKALLQRLSTIGSSSRGPSSTPPAWNMTGQSEMALAGQEVEEGLDRKETQPLSALPLHSPDTAVEEQQLQQHRLLPQHAMIVMLWCMLLPPWLLLLPWTSCIRAHCRYITHLIIYTGSCTAAETHQNHH